MTDTLDGTDPPRPDVDADTDTLASTDDAPADTADPSQADVDVSRDTAVADDLASPARRRHPIRLVALGVFAIAVLLSISLAKGLDRGRSVSSPLIGKPAPRFTLPRLDDTTTLDSRTLLGNVTVVNFWASWCIPCRQEAPNLESFTQRWAPAGVKLIGILYNDKVNDALAFRDEFGLTYPQVNDTDGAVAIDYGVTGVPETFIIDESGVVVAKIVGAVGPTTLDDVLARLANGTTVQINNGPTQSGPPPTTRP